MISEKIHKEIVRRIKKISFEKNPCFYLYDLGNITGKLDLLRENMPQNVKMFYSFKANPHQRIIRHMSSHPFIKGVEISSIGDLNKALKVYKPQDIIFVGPGKTLFEIRSALKKRPA